jgi:hypothetical protein
MTNTPKDGDFASMLEGAGRTAPQPAAAPDTRQTIQQVLVEGEEPTEEFLEEMKALREAPAVSDEELERQALEAGGADNDAGTPE